jgi:hypothetical protein
MSRFGFDQTQGNVSRVFFIPVRDRVEPGVDSKPDERHVGTTVDLDVKSAIQRYGIQTFTPAGLNIPPALLFNRFGDWDAASLVHCSSFGVRTLFGAHANPLASNSDIWRLASELCPAASEEDQSPQQKNGDQHDQPDGQRANEQRDHRQYESDVGKL